MVISQAARAAAHYTVPAVTANTLRQCHLAPRREEGRAGSVILGWDLSQRLHYIIVRSRNTEKPICM